MDTIMPVNSRVDLVHFVQALKLDLAAGKGEWENATLEKYLDAMAAWLEDMGGRPDISRQNPWQLFADILTASKTYE